jgi:hypothetical protein
VPVPVAVRVWLLSAALAPACRSHPASALTGAFAAPPSAGRRRSSSYPTDA